MPPPDVERLVVAVGATEERWRFGVGRERVEPLGAQPAKALTGQRVHSVVGDALRGGAHGVQAALREIEMETFGREYLRAVVESVGYRKIVAHG
jgi:hypothetical protein